MRIVVCVRFGQDGEPGPFDAAAYEAALRVPNAAVTLLSMAPPAASEQLLKLTRLGAENAVLLSDPAFAGADTLATAYTLSLAIGKLAPDLVFCGRQTLVGDTGQTGPMLAAMTKLASVSHVMSVDGVTNSEICCTTRTAGRVTAPLPALLTVERIHMLRLPRLRSKTGTVEVWNAETLGADITRCGLKGSPTRVLKTIENHAGKRKCRMISLDQLEETVAQGVARHKQSIAPAVVGERLGRVIIVGEAPRAYAETISDDIAVLSEENEKKLIEQIQAQNPDAVLFGSDPKAKMLAARVAAVCGLGLCADCTALAVEAGTLMMYRPALSGSLIAKIKSLTRPAMATVRTVEDSGRDVVVSLGFGAKNSIEKGKVLASRFGAALGASRRMVDEGLLPYDLQIGLTGKRVCPAVYVAIGISGAVHHIVGMERAGTVIAINKDPDAPIFEYADFGIIAEF